jgi:hypothetical protein
MRIILGVLEPHAARCAGGSPDGRGDLQAHQVPSRGASRTPSIPSWSSSGRARRSRLEKRSWRRPSRGPRGTVARPQGGRAVGVPGARGGRAGQEAADGDRRQGAGGAQGAAAPQQQRPVRPATGARAAAVRGSAGGGSRPRPGRGGTGHRPGRVRRAGAAAGHHHAPYEDAGGSGDTDVPPTQATTANVGLVQRALTMVGLGGSGILAAWVVSKAARMPLALLCNGGAPACAAGLALLP